jgi:GMP synthase PP-ATPase subunit
MGCSLRTDAKAGPAGKGINELRGINRVGYDITSKPPGARE